MSESVDFIQGRKEQYNPSEMQGGLFFSKDSKEILLNGESYGNATPADEEDITAESGNLKLKDRAYDEASFSGKGYKILRKNIVEGKNILTQDMINEPNTIYEIRYDFDLNEATINIPEGCVLKFDGGKVSNGTLNGSNTALSSSPVHIFDSITITGVWNVSEAFSEWFNLDYVSTINAFHQIDFIGSYLITSPIVADLGDNGLVLKFHPKSVVKCSDSFDGSYLFQITSNDNTTGSKYVACDRIQIEGPGYIDLNDRCGFFKEVPGVSGKGRGINISNIQVYAAAKVVQDPDSEFNAIVCVDQSSVMMNCDFMCTRESSVTKPEYGIYLGGADHKLVRITVIISTIGIGHIAGNTFINDAHIWGAPQVAFQVTGAATINNTYGDWALVGFDVSASRVSIQNYNTIGSTEPDSPWYQGKNMAFIRTTQTNLRGWATICSQTPQIKYIINQDGEEIQAPNLLLRDWTQDKQTDNYYRCLVKKEQSEDTWIKLCSVELWHDRHLTIRYDNSASVYCTFELKRQSIGSGESWLYFEILDSSLYTSDFVSLYGVQEAEGETLTIYAKVTGVYPVLYVYNLEPGIIYYGSVLTNDPSEISGFRQIPIWRHRGSQDQYPSGLNSQHKGYQYFNTSTNKVNYWNGTSWIDPTENISWATIE